VLLLSQSAAIIERVDLGYARSLTHPVV
jgi:hypothetical protein